MTHTSSTPNSRYVKTRSAMGLRRSFEEATSQTNSGTWSV
jgi:hypothetical protein